MSLQAGVADLTGNARPRLLSWTFDVSSSLTIENVTPSGQFSIPGGTLPPILVKFKRAISPEAFSTLNFQFVRPGPDGRLWTADDEPVGPGTASLVAADTVAVVAPEGVRAGLNGLRVLSSLLITSADYPLEFRTVANEWVAPGDGLWSVAAKWSRGAIWAGDQLFIPGPASRITTADLATTLSGLESDAALVVRRSTALRGPARLRGGLSLEPGNLILSGGGQWDVRGGVLIRSTTVEHDSLALDDITLVNHDTAQWSAGQIRVTSPAARWVNQPTGTFVVGSNATRFASQPPNNAVSGRFFNFGR